MSTPYVSIYTGLEIDEGISRAFAAKAQLDNSYSGTWDISAGATSGTVSGLNLPFLPVRAILTLEIAGTGAVVQVCLVSGTLYSGGFGFKLSAAASAGSRLHFRLEGDLEGDSSGG